MFQLAQSFGLNLADTFARNVKLLSDLFQSMVGIHAYAETHAQHTFFARRQ